MIWTVRTDLGPLVLREQIEPSDEPELLALFRECDDWFEATTGGPSGPGDVQSLFYNFPEGTTFEDKHLFTLRDDERIIGFVDAVAGFPGPRSCAVGSFLIAPAYRRRGVATAVARILIDEARTAGFKQITATATDTWPAGTEFLRSLGFDVGDVLAGEDSIARTHESPVRRAHLGLDGSGQRQFDR